LHIPCEVFLFNGIKVPKSLINFFNLLYIRLTRHFTKLKRRFRKLLLDINYLLQGFILFDLGLVYYLFTMIIFA